jgi:hypothetical protein
MSPETFATPQTTSPAIPSGVPPEPVILEMPFAHPYRAEPIVVSSIRPSKSKPHPVRGRELAVLAGFPVLVNVCVWGDTGGFGLAALLFGTVALVLIGRRHVRWTAEAIALGVLTLSLAARAAYQGTAGAGFLGLLFATAFAMSLWQKKLHVPEFLYAGIKQTGLVWAQVGAFASRASRYVVGRGKMTTLWLGVGIPLACVAVFSGIFALANPIVERMAHSLFDALARILTTEVILRICLAACGIVGGVALLRPQLAMTKDESVPPTMEASTSLKLVARDALIGLNVLFLAYNALDVVSLWFGHLPAEITTQRYAHEGAAWLTVALSLTTMVLSVLFRDSLTVDEGAKRVRALAYAWIGQNLFLAVGTFARMAMHVSYSGMSDLRFVGFFGATLATGGLVLAFVKVRHGRTFGWLVRRQLDAFVVMAALYVLLPTHRISAAINVSRLENDQLGALVHVHEQAKNDESVATLIPLLHHSNDTVRKGVAAMMSSKLEELRERHLGQATWRAKDIAGRRALDALAVNEADINGALGLTASGEVVDAPVEALDPSPVPDAAAAFASPPKDAHVTRYPRPATRDEMYQRRAAPIQQFDNLRDERSWESSRRLAK